jgi:hypothetical protein
MRGALSLCRANCQEKANRHKADLAPIIWDIQAAGASSLRQVAAELTRRGITTAQGRAWSAVQVQRVMERA